MNHEDVSQATSFRPIITSGEWHLQIIIWPKSLASRCPCFVSVSDFGHHPSFWMRKAF